MCVFKRFCDPFIYLFIIILFIYFFFCKGDIYDHNSLVEAIKEVDVVISTVGFEQITDQVKIIAAIKEAGNIKVLALTLLLIRL